ncbi:MAG: tetratricopeptide repeat protein [Rhodospirillaceae bacterium]
MTLRCLGAGAAMLGLAACAGVPQPAPAASPTAFYDHGKEHFRAGRLGLALNAFQAARQADPGSTNALNGIGAVYDRMGRHVQAEQAYLEALALAPQDATTLNNIGWSRHMRGQTAVAAFYLSRAVELAPNDPVMQANLMRVESDLPASPQAPPVDLRDALGPPYIERRSATEQMLMTAAVAPRTPLSGGAEIQDILERRTAPAPVAAATTRTKPVAAAEQEGVAAREAAPHPPAPPLSGVEVSNGNGRRLMATRVAAWLADRAVTVVRLTNADTFAHARSVITYTSASGPDAARALAARLPQTVDIRPAGPDQTSPLRLIVGADLLDFDHHLVAAQRSSSDA